MNRVKGKTVSALILKTSTLHRPYTTGIIFYIKMIFKVLEPRMFNKILWCLYLGKKYVHTMYIFVKLKNSAQCKFYWRNDFPE